MIKIIIKQKKRKAINVLVTDRARARVCVYRMCLYGGVFNVFNVQKYRFRL